MHNIICLENEWLFNSQKKDNQFNLETKHLLNCLSNFHDCNFIHRSVLSKEDLIYYMNFFTNDKRRFNKYDIIYFACHGCSACRTLANEAAALDFKKQTGAKLVSGYKLSVDAMKSAIADLAYFNDLMHIKNVGIMLNEDISKFWKTYRSLLDELKFITV